MIKWNNILDVRPEDDSIIIQFEPRPAEFKALLPCLSFRIWDPKCTWEELSKHYTDREHTHPEWWWVYAYDMNWPEGKNDV